MNRTLLPLLLALMAACDSDSTPLTPVPFAPRAAGGSVFGTASNDLWRIWSDGKDAAGGQWDIFIHQVEYFDGTEIRPVAFPTEVFRDVTCGRPTAFAASGKGALWLAGVLVPQCGLDPNRVSGSRVIFGVLEADGTFIDYSDDLETRAPGTYQEVRLQGRGGLVALTVRSQTQGSMTYETHFYDIGGKRQMKALPEDAWVVSVLSPKDVIAGGNDVTYRLSDDAWERLPPGTVGEPPGMPATHAGAIWAFAYGNVRQQPEQVAHRYVDGVFTPVPFLLPRPEGTTWRPIALVPTGREQFTLVGVRERYTDMNDTATRIVARRFDGTALSATDDAIGPAWRCDGRNNADCPVGPLRHHASLEDGTTLLVTENDSVHPVTWFLLRTSDIP